MKDEDDNLYVTVCANCLTAACWHGEFMCDEAYTSGTVSRTIKELRELNREHEHHWKIRNTKPVTK